MKRILAFVLLLSTILCVMPATAAPIYNVEADAQPFTYNAKASVIDNGIALAEVTQSELALLFQQYFYYGGDEVGYWIYQLYNQLSLTTNDYLSDISFAVGTRSGSGNSILQWLSSIYSSIADTNDALDYVNSNLSATGNYLNQSGGTTSSSLTAVSIGQLVRNGFLGLSVKLEDLADAVDGGSDYTSVLSQILTAAININTSVGKVETSVGKVETAVVDVLTAVGDVNSSVLDVVSDLEVSTSNVALGSTGYSTTVNAGTPVTSLVRSGFVGLSRILNVPTGVSYLSANGSSSVSSSEIFLNQLLRSGFLGIRSLIAGSESDNAYSLTLWDNNNTSTSSTATGLGPMLNSHFGSAGENLAKLSFMFAADDDIELKSDSQPAVDAVTSEVFEGDGKVKLDGAKVSSLTGISNDVLGYFDNGGELSDVDTVMNDSSTWKWFTSDTAADLDTTTSTYSVRSVPASDAHADWYSSFYRNVLGREYKGE